MVLLAKGVFIAAIILIMVLAAFFMVCRKYEEGWVGNLALGIFIEIACGLTLADAWFDKLELPEPHYYMLILGLVIFFARHAYRFAMFHWHGWFGWKRPVDMPQDAGR